MLAFADLPDHACVPSPDQQDLCLAQLQLLRFLNCTAVLAVLWALALAQQPGAAAPHVDKQRALQRPAASR